MDGDPFLGESGAEEASAVSLLGLAAEAAEKLPAVPWQLPLASNRNP